MQCLHLMPGSSEGGFLAAAEPCEKLLYFFLFQRLQQQHKEPTRVMRVPANSTVCSASPSSSPLTQCWTRNSPLPTRSMLVSWTALAWTLERPFTSCTRSPPHTMNTALCLVTHEQIHPLLPEQRATQSRHE